MQIMWTEKRLLGQMNEVSIVVYHIGRRKKGFDQRLSIYSFGLETPVLARKEPIHPYESSCLSGRSWITDCCDIPRDQQKLEA